MDDAATTAMPVRYDYLVEGKSKNDGMRKAAPTVGFGCLLLVTMDSDFTAFVLFFFPS